MTVGPPASQPVHRVVPPDDRLLSLRKPVTADPSVPLTDEQKASGTVDYSPEVAVDGQAYDIDVHDGVEQYYQPRPMPFQWMVDLGAAHRLTRVGLSFKTVGGSDAADRYTVETSNDKVHWTEQVDNTQNNVVGYQSHGLNGKFRYVRVTDFSTYDIAHHKEADWETGLYEISVHGL